MGSPIRLATVDGKRTPAAPARARRRRAAQAVPDLEVAVWSTRAASCSAQHAGLAVESLKAQIAGGTVDAVVLAGLAIILEREVQAATSYAENAAAALDRVKP